MTICIFPGTFNPIHEGHLRMAKFALENYHFDKIIFIPSYIPPHKNLNKDLAKHRYRMVEMVTSSNPKFEVSDIEYKSEGKSYSLITVTKIIEQYKISGFLNFIIGTDAFAKLDSWYHSDELKPMVHFIVFPRHGEEVDFDRFAENGWSFELASAEYFDISSTEIRAGADIGKNTAESKEIEGYIKKHGLYGN